MKRLISLLTIFFFLFPAIVFAHPGKTAADGCHVCQSNCAKWGVAKGVRHCHSWGSEQAPDSETKTETKMKNNTSAKVKAPGWEYSLKIQKISAQEFKRNK